MMQSKFSVELLLNNLPGVVYRCKPDANWTMEFMSPWIQRLTGFTAEDFVNNQKRSYAELMVPEDRDYVARVVQESIEARTLFQVTYRIIDSSDSLRWVWEQGQAVYDENNNAVALEGFITDITEQKQAESRLEKLATYDTLTGLPNRTFLNRHLQKLLEDTFFGEPVAIMFIDLDRFKQINDTMGHDPGDFLLREVALRLQRTLRPGDVVARLGGDEFIVTARCPQGEDSAAVIAKKIHAGLSAPFVIEGQEVFVTASIGISMAPQDGKTKDALFKNADIAMYRAKEAGRNGYCFFHMEMSEAAKFRRVLENSLHRALERDEFSLHYQPRVNLATLQIVGMEALIRWNHPELGQVPPLQFISIAEECGMIESIGHWVLEEACRQTKRLMDQLGYPLRISVNLSARQLRSSDLARQVSRILETTGLPGHLLELELTESALIEDMEASAAMLTELKKLGVELAVDDFGTGYSGLAYLQRFPLDVLKLDRTFITENAEGNKNLKFIKAFLDLAHALNLSVVAEGIETREVLDMLRGFSCDEGQGYLFARPLPCHQLEVLLASSTTFTP
jgi:diguanylate cyclase (GGDEF)-like protein/PAS domain S-box-containing protein